MTTVQDHAFRCRLILGALLLQASFSTDRRQALGMAAAIAPILARDGNRARRGRRLAPYLETYNTNPAMAGPLLGALGRLEERANGGDEAAGREAERLRRALEAPLAARGDSLLWSALRPATVLLGALLAWGVGLPGIALFLILYNVVHLGIRAGGVYWGYAHPDRITALLRTSWPRHAVPLLRKASAGVLLLLAGFLLLPGSSWGTGGACLIAAGAAWGRGRWSFAHGGLVAGGAIMFGLILALLFGRSGT